MREAWRPLMFSDPDQGAKLERDPVAPAKRSQAALKKIKLRTLDDVSPVHSFSTLMADLSTIVRNSCRIPHAGPHAPLFTVLTTRGVRTFGIG